MRIAQVIKAKKLTPGVRVLVFDGRFEIMRERTMTLAFDEDALGFEAYAQQSTCDAMLHNLAKIALRSGETRDVEDVRLELWDMQLTRKAYDWYGR